MNFILSKSDTAAIKGLAILAIIFHTYTMFPLVAIGIY